MNKLSLRVRSLLRKTVTPIAMGFLFYSTVTPVALLMRLFGRDALLLKRDDAAASYWLPRKPPGPERGSMRDQF